MTTRTQKSTPDQREPYDVWSPAAKQRCVKLTTVIRDYGLLHSHSKTASCGLLRCGKRAACIAWHSISFLDGACTPMQWPSTHAASRTCNECDLTIICTVAQRICCKELARATAALVRTTVSSSPSSPQGGNAAAPLARTDLAVYVSRTSINALVVLQGAVCRDAGLRAPSQWTLVYGRSAVLP